MFGREVLSFVFAPCFKIERVALFEFVCLFVGGGESPRQDGPDVCNHLCNYVVRCAVRCVVVRAVRCFAELGSHKLFVL